MKGFVRASAWLVVVLAAVVAVPLAFAQGFPTRAVKLWVPYSVGSATDVLARTLGERLSAAWAQPVVIEDQPGANGTIVTATVAKSPPDGYTLIMIAANHVINASLYRNLPYDDVKDFRAIARIGQASFVLCVNPALPVHSLADLVALAKQQPGKINYSSPGNGTPGHLAMEMLKTQSGAQVVHVPYKGAAQATTDLVGGQVQVGFVVESTAIPLIKSGQLRALAISSASRSARLPDVPTISEEGFPGFEVVSWIGLVGPAHMPDDVVAKISTDALRAVDTPEMRDRLAGLGLSVFPADAATFAAYISGEHDKWAKVVKASGARLD